MPRKADRRNADEQARVADWRAEQSEKGAPETSGRPEGSAVDLALAAAATAYIAAAQESGRRGHRQVSKALMGAALDILAAGRKATRTKPAKPGYDRKESAAKLRDRLRRRDLLDVCEVARIEDRLQVLVERSPSP